jgi:hypothetical protein
MATRVKMKSAGIKELLNSGETRAMLTSKARGALAAARANAPVATGEYRASLQIVQDTTDRAVVRVGSTAPHALAVEANTGNLARALDAAR